MNKRVKNSIILLLLGTYIFLYVFYILDKFLKYSESITAAFMIVLAFIAYLFYGFAKDKKTYARKSIFQIIITQIILFFLVSYGLGLAIGFLKNSYSLRFLSIVDNIFAPFALLIAVELFRYMYIVPNKDSKFSMYLITFALIALESVMSVRAYHLNEFEGLFRFITMIFLPSLVKNGMLSYVTYNVGYKPSILYRVIMDGYIFIVPICPDIGDYLSSMFGIGVPFLIYLYSSRFIHEYNDGIEREFTSTTFRPFDFVVIIAFLILAALISGYFPLFMIGIGSASMEPKINVGDAVLGLKVKENDLKVDDVIVYQGEKKLVVHRIVSIEKKNNKIYYHTKGDNNRTEDSLTISYANVKGKVLFRIPYIAYPAVYFSQLINGDD